MEHNLENATDYHYDQFPPNDLDYAKFVEPLIKATDAVARYVLFAACKQFVKR